MRGPLWLVVRGAEPPRYVAMTGERLTVGRDLRNEVVLDDTKVSRHHAEIVRDGSGHYILTDLASHNGTTVDGRQLVGSFLLNGGEVVRFGRTIVEILTTTPEGVT